MQHLEHGTAGLDDPVRRQAFAEQVLAGNAAVGHVDVADVVHDPAVDLLGHALIEAAVACLHVEDRDFASLGRVGGQAGIGVAQHQQGVRFDLAEHGIHLGNDVPDRFGSGRAGGAEEVIRFAEFEIVEEDLV